jgi:hypothetical protein
VEYEFFGGLYEVEYVCEDLMEAVLIDFLQKMEEDELYVV